MHKIYYLSTGNYSIFAQPSLINVLKQKFAYHVLCKIMAMFILGPLAPSQFSSELDQVGCREQVHDDCALHHFSLNSISLELKFKPEPVISSDQALNFDFTQVNKKR